MTSPVSISFHKPPQKNSSLALIQGLDSRKSSCCGDLVKNPTAINFYDKIRGMVSVNRSCNSRIMLTAIHIHEQTLSHIFDEEGDPSRDAEDAPQKTEGTPGAEQGHIEPDPKILQAIVPVDQGEADSEPDNTFAMPPLVNPYPLRKDVRFQSSANNMIGEYLKKVLTPEEFAAFTDTCFGLYLNIKDCSHQGHIYRCIRESQVQSPREDELWIDVNGKLLKFTILEFALLTGLRVDTNEDDFDFIGEPECRLLKWYFRHRPSVSKAALLNAFERRCFRNNPGDAVKMAVLVFINTFILSQSDDTNIPFKYFHLVESGRYTQYPWGKVAFRQTIEDFKNPLVLRNQINRIHGMPYALQLWIYECCGNLPVKVAVQEEEENLTIPRILNWRVVAKKLLYNFAKHNVFGAYEFNNIHPTVNESRTFSLPPRNSSTGPFSPPTTHVLAIRPLRTVQHDDNDDFEDPAPQLIRRPGLRSGQVTDQARKKRRTVPGTSNKRAVVSETPKPAQESARECDQNIIADGSANVAEEKLLVTSYNEDVLSTKKMAEPHASEAVKMENKVVTKTYQRRKKAQDRLKVADAASKDTGGETSKQGSELTPLEADEIIKKFVASLGGVTDIHGDASASCHYTEWFTEEGRPSPPPPPVDNVSASTLEAVPPQVPGVTMPTTVVQTDTNVLAAQMPHATAQAPVDAKAPDPIITATTQTQYMSKTDLEALNNSLIKHIDENSYELRRYFKRKMKAVKMTFKKKIRRLKELVADERNDDNESVANEAPNVQELQNLAAQGSEHYTDLDGATEVGKDDGNYNAEDPPKDNVEDVSVAQEQVVASNLEDTFDGSLNKNLSQIEAEHAKDSKTTTSVAAELDPRSCSFQMQVCQRENPESPYVTKYQKTANESQLVPPTLPLPHPFSLSHLTTTELENIKAAFCMWLAEGLLSTHSLKSWAADHYKSQRATLAPPMDLVVAFPNDKNWFYRMAQLDICWGDEHIDVVFYYLRKKSKFSGVSDYRYTTGTCLFRDKVNEKFCKLNKDTSDASSFGVDDPICRYIQGFSVPAGLPWHLVDDVFIPVNIIEKIHWVLAVVNLKHRSIMIYDSMVESGALHRAGVLSEISKLAQILPYYIHLSGFLEHNERHAWKELDAYRDKSPDDPFAVVYQDRIPQQKPGSLDCGVYVAAFTEMLGNCSPIVSFREIDADQFRIRYASLVWNYAVKKLADGYKSDNNDPTRPRRSAAVLETEDAVCLDEE